MVNTQADRDLDEKRKAFEDNVENSIKPKGPKMSNEFQLFSESDCDTTSAYQHTKGYVMVCDCISLVKANRLFREWLAKGTVVYGELESGREVPVWNARFDEGIDTHTAILVQVRPIEPKVLSREQCDALKINGFNAEQIEKMAHFYIMETGVDLRLPIEPEDSAEKLIEEISKLDCDKYLGVSYAEDQLWSFAKRAKKLIGVKK